MKLRTYQQHIIEKVNEFVKTDEYELVIKLFTGLGKSHTIPRIAKQLKNQEYRVLVLSDISQLINQLEEHFSNMSLEVSKIVSKNKNTTFGSITLAMEQTLYNRLKKIDIDQSYTYVILYDECFTPDVEIMTNKGWIRFDKLDINDVDLKIAQFDDNNKKIYFTKNWKLKCNYRKEKIYKVETDKIFDFSCTFNHEFLLYDKKEDKFIKKEIKDINSSNRYKIPLCGIGSGKEKYLTTYEKLAIAFQADGSYHYKYKNASNNTKKQKNEFGSILFSFSKERKIKEILELSKFFNFKELKSDKRLKNIKRRFLFTQIDLSKISKNFFDVFNIENFSYQKAKEFIKYLTIWDRYINTNNKKENYYYSTIIKENADFVQQVAILAGYRAIISKQIDNRKDTYNNVYRVFITKNEFASLQKISKLKKEINYDGYVYCVEVPTHNIIIRRNGKAIITGNCHKRRYGQRFIEIVNAFDRKKLIGFSATPFDMNGVKMFYNIYEPISYKEAENKGYITPMKYFIPKVVTSLDFDSMDKSVGSDYTANDIRQLYGTDEFKQWFSSFIKKLEPINRQTLVFVSNIEMAEEYRELLRKIEPTSEVVHSKQHKLENDRVIEEFKKGNIKILISITSLTTGFDAPNVDTIISLRPTKSKPLLFQKIGRGSRLYEGKEYCEYYDITNNLITHGLPETFTCFGSTSEIKEDKLIDKLVTFSKEPIIEVNEDILHNFEIELEEMQKNKSYHLMDMNDLKIRFELAETCEELILIGNEVARRLNRKTYAEDYLVGSVATEMDKYLNILDEKYNKRKSTLKAYRTRIRNIVNNGGKLASMKYFPKWYFEIVQEKYGIRM